MESTSYHCFDKPTVSVIETASLGENCRLRHQLNSDCLVKIFDYLSVQDLTRLSKLDTYFYDLITSEVIAKKVIDFGVMDKRMPNNRIVLQHSTIELLGLFGKFMKQIIIRGEDFHLFLSTIIQHCRPGRLTNVDMSFKINSGIPASHLVDQSVPFFTNLRRLRLSDNSSSGLCRLYQRFLEKISSAVPKLAILQLHQVNISGGWLQKLDNLTELQIDSPMVFSFVDVTSCLKVNPKLTAFEYKGTADLKSIYDTLAACCPGIRTFSDCHFRNIYNVFDTNVVNRYDFLSLFKQLENVTLTSYTESGHDLDNHLKIPALANISALKVYMNSDRPIYLSRQVKEHLVESFFESFDNLKTIEIEIRRMDVINCDLRCEFIFNLLSGLKNVENIKFVGRSWTNMNSLLHHSTNIRSLCIADTHFHSADVSLEMRKIVETLRRISSRRTLEVKYENQLLHLEVNQYRWIEIKVNGEAVTTDE